jgi:hypothetical protein
MKMIYLFNSTQQTHTLSSPTSQRLNQSLPKSVPVLPEKKKLKISLPFYKNLNTNTQTGDTNQKQGNLNLDIATNIDLKTKRMKKASLQHCISVMRAELPKMSIYAPNKLYGERTVNRSENPHYAYT